MKTIIIFSIVLLLAVAGAYYFGFQKGYSKGMEVGQAAARVGAGGTVQAPLGEMPSINPFEQAINPFKDLYNNPFK